MNWLTSQFELSRGGENSNIRPMEGLRGFAVLLVFLVHYSTLAQPWLPANSSTALVADALHKLGHSGVDMFFVLSGYLIYSSLINRHQSYGRFLCRRIERLYPTFATVFALYLLLSFLFPSESKIPSGVGAAALYLVQNFLLLPGLFPIEPMITVAWSLSYELFYYLTIPLAVTIFGLRRRPIYWRISMVSLVAVLFIQYCTIAGGPFRLVMFLAGILLFDVIALLERRPNLDMFAGVTALGLALASMLLPSSGPVTYAVKISILFITFFIVCFICLVNSSGRFALLFVWRPMRWLGNMSYSYYLIHGLALKAAFLLLSKCLLIAALGEWVFWFLMPVMFLITIPPAVALFILVERPYSLFPSRKSRAVAKFVRGA